MPLTPIATFGGQILQPSHNPHLAATIAVTLAQGTYQVGQVLGQISSANVNDVQTITIGGSPTGGSFLIYNLPGGLQYRATYNVTTAALQTALRSLLAAYGTAVVAVTGTAGSSYVLTYSGANLAGQPIALAAVDGAALTGGTPTWAIAHTTPGVGPLNAYGAYASGNSDGTQTPRCVLQFPCTVDYAGNISYANEWINTHRTVPAFNRGQFFCADLVGLDSGALGTRFVLLSGTVSTGEVELP